jgi:ribosomal protein L1
MKKLYNKIFNFLKFFKKLNLNLLNNKIYLKIQFKSKFKELINFVMKLPYNLFLKNYKLACYIKNKNITEINEFKKYIVSLEEIKKTFNFNVLITTPQSVKDLKIISKKLNNKNLMPSIELGTITTNVKQAINEFLKNKKIYTIKKNQNFCISIGKLYFSYKMILKNIIYIINSILFNNSINNKIKSISIIFQSKKK